VTNLIFVRHGETEWNTIGRLQGQADIALSERGREQVVSIRPIIDQLSPTMVVASDLRRAHETASLLGYPDPHLERGLREADLGAWTSQLIAELRSEVPEQYRAWRAGTFNPPGAETWEQMRARVGHVLAQMQSSGETILIVTHGGPIRAACSLLVDLHPAEIMPVAPASITTFTITDRPRLVCFNLLHGRVALDSPD
jgi:glucosyl-3-phosphoglycerate phosphatase